MVWKKTGPHSFVLERCPVYVTAYVSELSGLIRPFTNLT